MVRVVLIYRGPGIDETTDKHKKGNRKKKKTLFPKLEHRVSLKLRLSEGQQDGTVGHGACCASLET